jgi:iron complex transport system substrate-binding protein
MLRSSKLPALSVTALAVLGLAACSSSAESDSPEESTEQDSGGQTAEGPAAEWEPVTIEHALGTTTIETEPERVATVNWANHEVPLALGVVPVGMAETTWGDDDGDGVHPWVEERLEELGAETPPLFDETDGIDFEAVANTEPDVILAAYSGLSQEDYDTLSEIAPVVAYPEAAWATSWRDTITVNSEALGMAEEGQALVADLEAEIDAAVAEHPELEGTSAMFISHVDVTDLSEVNFYSAKDTRLKFFEDLGMRIPDSLAEVSAGSDSFNGSVSTEQADMFSDVDIIVTYGGDELISAMESDPVLSQLPAVANGAIVNLPGEKPLGTAANPTPLAISWMLEDYLALLADAAGKGE